MKTKLLITLLTAGAFAAGSASAAIVFSDVRLSEDFEGQVASTQASAANTAFTNFLETADAGVSFVEFRDDTTGLFGANTSNGYLRIRVDNETGESSMGWANSGSDSASDFGAIVSYQFTFNDNSGGTADPSDNFLFRLSTIAGDTGTNSAAVKGELNSFDNTITFADNTGSFSYSNGVAYTIQVVANNSGVADTYNGSTVLGQGFDVYIDGNLEFDDLTFSNSPTSGEVFEAVSFQSRPDAIDLNMSVDNVTLTAVPEPSTYAIYAGLLALGLVTVRRRLRNA